MAITEERQQKTETDVNELKVAQTRTDLAISKIGDAVDALTKITVKSEEEKNTAFKRVLVIISLVMIIVGGIVSGASYLINAQLAASAAVREYRLTELENLVKENIKVTIQWKTTTEAK